MDALLHGELITIVTLDTVTMVTKLLLRKIESPECLKTRGGQMGAKEPIVAPPGFLVALG